MLVKRFIVAGTLLAIAGFFLSCTSNNYSGDVNRELDAAGDNRTELQKAITHYDSLGDSLKLEAAFFLIGNMEDHAYGTYALRDSSEKDIYLNVLDHPDYDAVIVYLDSIENERGELDFGRDEKIEDIVTISADYLIDQIDWAFRAWQEKPWAANLSFEQFCDYVLPYRGSGEPLESWREYFWEKYQGIEDSMETPSDPVEAACLINDDVRSYFTFDPRFYLHPTDQGLSEMLSNGLGRCEDMTNITIYALRANGLAVTSDYTPYWADCGNNHAWNAILAADGKVIPFMGAEANPGKYNLSHKMAKAYRKMYSKQKDNLAFQDNKQEKTPRWLSGKSYQDVTADYVDVCDVTVEFDKEIPDSVNFAYLCVFNSGKWGAIHWAKIENKTATFTDMGISIAYLPALYLDKEVVPWGNPFILHDDCNVEKLEVNTDQTISVSLTSTTRRKQLASTDGVAVSSLDPGTEYELSYFNDGWQSIDKAVAGEEPLVFDSVPVGYLYWLVAKDSDREERIFTIEDNSQLWW
ncbi:MAG: hypothetical protein DRP45_05390 [Candidatus Zixiibacteriota bacterium]|nr:MAG: hypothetical protein DRP45_05390 [candidate division Zixibacteria bacterium]